MPAIKLQANGTKLSITQPFNLVSTQNNYDSCEFAFDSSWNGYTKTAIFYSDTTSKKSIELVDNKCVIPWENLVNDGILFIGVFGVNGTSVLPTNFVDQPLIPGSYVGADPTQPTQDIYTQLISDMNSFRDEEAARVIAENTRVSQESARQLAESSRNTDENTRDAHETDRQTQESTRKSQEETRQGNETDRQNYYNAYKLCEPYNPETPYIVGNKVTYQGGTYQCILACTGISPTYNTDNANWICIAAKGMDGTGIGDMIRNVYDTQNKATDIFTYTDNKVGDTTQLPTVDKTNVVNSIKEVSGQLATIAINVKSYGAKGDGVTDDTVAIQNALNSDYNTVNFEPNKTYIISAKLYVRTDGKVINGNNATIKIASSVAETYISNVDNFAFKIYDCDDVHVFNLNIDGSRPFIERTDDTTGDYASNTALYLSKRENGFSGIGFEKCNNVSVIECSAHNTASGIGMKNTNGGIIKRCKVTYTATDAFPLYHGIKNIYVEDCCCEYNGDDAYSVYGLTKYWTDDTIEIDVDQPENIHFINCYATQCRSRGFINSGGKNVFFDNCVFDGVMWGFRIAYDSSVAMYHSDNTYVNNCHILITPFAGITTTFAANINDANKVIFNHCEVETNDSISSNTKIRVTGLTELYLDDIKITNAYLFDDIEGDTVTKVSLINVIQNSAGYTVLRGVQELLVRDCEIYNSGTVIAYFVNTVNLTVVNLKGDSGKLLNCNATNLTTDNINIFTSALITGSTNVKLKTPQFGSALYNGIFNTNAIHFLSGVPYFFNGSAWARPNFVPIESTKNSGSCNDLYGTNGLKVHIVTSMVTEIPASAIFFIITIESIGAGVKVQIAIGVADGSLYVRTGTGAWNAK